MGEAIISRAGGGSSNSDVIVPITPGYHTILLTLKTADGIPVANTVVSCKDGSSYYNYTTNEKGQCMYVCNSGSANLLCKTTLDGVAYDDIIDTWMNIDAPVGLSSKVNFVHNHPEYVEFLANKNFVFSSNRNCNIYIIGGGGGGAGTACSGATKDSWEYHAAGGGGGYYNLYQDQKIQARETYEFVVGKGGSAGLSAKNHTNGGAGGTSYIKNTIYSAIGGEGAPDAYGKQLAYKGGNGSTGNGGGKNGGKSPLNFAGGGGGFGWGSADLYGRMGEGTWNTGYWFPGAPYGGRGGLACYREYTNRNGYYKNGTVNATAGKRGGGGGGGYAGGHSFLDGYGYDMNGAAGRDGLVRIYIL